MWDVEWQSVDYWFLCVDSLPLLVAVDVELDNAGALPLLDRPRVASWVKLESHPSPNEMSAIIKLNLKCF